MENQHPTSEASFPATPLQAGMVARALADAPRGLDIEQLVMTLRETFDPAAFAEAWQHTAARHQALRSAFDVRDFPQQQVFTKIPLPLEPHECVGIAPEAREAFLAEWLAEDRARGFAMDTPPLMRLAWIRFAPDEHRIVWTFHHALLDGRSIVIVLRDVFACYEAVRSGRRVALPASRPFGDFAAWLQARDPHASESFWREELRGFTAPTPLAAEGLPDCARTSAASEAALRLPAAVTAELRSLAGREGFTLHTVVQGAWALLLSRYSGEADVVFGTTRACRHGTIEGAAEIAGLFINTLPLRVTLPPEAAVLSWLRELRTRWVTMRKHEHTPLSRVQGWSEIPAGRALFDTLVVFERGELDALLRDAGVASPERSFRLHEATGFGLTLNACDGPELSLRLLFDRARFSGETAGRILGQLRRILESFAAAPGQRVRDVPLLTAAEERALFFDWMPAPAVPPREITLHELFLQQAARTPDAIALTCGPQDMTYAELDARASRLAAHLRASGAAPEVIVGLWLENSCDLIVGLLGILKAGAAYLPIDASTPPARAAALLADAQAPLLLTTPARAATLPPHAARVVSLETCDFSEEPIAAAEHRATADHLAYVIYTSGSTGQPNGCCIPHRNVVRLFDATARHFDFGAADVWTLFHSIAFDFSVWEIWGALLHGGRLVIVPEDTRRAPDDFLALLARERVTVLNQTPSAFRQLIAAQRPETALSLRFVIFGGEALDVRSLEPWFARHGDAQPQLVNMYGITETTVHVTHRALRVADLEGGSVIGRPLADLQALVLDPALRPVPIGVPGELFVGGAGLAREYLRRPELTAQRFIATPASLAALAPHLPPRLYRTGDLVRWLPGGELEYLGRRDQQVKIRGHRIEPGEIEATLRRFPGVRDAAVLAREDATGALRLAAWIAARELDEAALREWLRARLPGYMIPATLQRLDHLPLTGNGKLNRSALPLPARATVPAASPSTPLEHTIATVWAEILDSGNLGVDETFFDLGGDSLLLVRMHQRLCETLAREFPLTTHFRFPTVRMLARHLADQGTRSGTPATVQERAARQRDAFARRKTQAQTLSR